MEDSNLRPQGCKPCAQANRANCPARLGISRRSIDGPMDPDPRRGETLFPLQAGSLYQSQTQGHSIAGPKHNPWACLHLLKLQWHLFGSRATSPNVRRLIRALSNGMVKELNQDTRPTLSVPSRVSWTFEWPNESPGGWFREKLSAPPLFLAQRSRTRQRPTERKPTVLQLYRRSKLLFIVSVRTLSTSH